MSLGKEILIIEQGEAGREIAVCLPCYASQFGRGLDSTGGNGKLGAIFGSHGVGLQSVEMSPLGPAASGLRS